MICLYHVKVPDDLVEGLEAQHAGAEVGAAVLEGVHEVGDGGEEDGHVVVGLRVEAARLTVARKVVLRCQKKLFP